MNKRIEKMKCTATFMGSPNSMGFQRKMKYRLKVRFYPDGNLIISTGFWSSLGCSYSSINAFFNNWDVHAWE